MPTVPPVVIRTRSLEKRYGDKIAVRSLDLEVHQGEIFGLLGPNGAGKTTTILMLLGLTEPTSGTAEVNGLDPLRSPLQVKRKVGYLPDNVGFYGSMTGRENLRYTARLNGLSEKEAVSRIADLLDRIGLTDAADQKVDTYSRGMKQRLGLGDCLVKEPSVIILDEPTTSIDPVGVNEMLALVRELAHEQGVAVLLSSHQLSQVQQVCDRIAIFVSGEVVASGTLQQLAQRQATGLNVSIEIGADGDPSAVAATLRSVPGVTSVEADDRDSRIWIVTGSSDVRLALAKALVAAGQAPWHVNDRGTDLTDIYQRYFTGTSIPPSHRTRLAIDTDAVPSGVPSVASPSTRRAAAVARRRQIHKSGRRPSGRSDGGSARG